ncbi:MAG: hypothetical protein Q4B71_06535 [Cardiobacteriaceae bacterium]|nr:hypothetical protein [Cardiobacteriaceae bacterium]
MPLHQNTLITSLILLMLVAFTLLALLDFGKQAVALWHRIHRHFQERQQQQRQQRSGQVAPHQYGKLPEDTPQLSLHIDLVPQFDPSFSATQIHQLTHHFPISTHTSPTPHLLYHHPDNLTFTLHNIHPSALPAQNSNERVFGLRLSLHLPCECNNTLAVSALLAVADKIAENLSGKPCRANTRQRLKPSEREWYHRVAEEHQSAYEAWQYRQLQDKP